MARHQHHKGNADSQTLSPSQRYASFQKVQRHRASAAARFAESLPFELDDFQTEANDALEAGSNVLVAAPTGAGKTVIFDAVSYALYGQTSGGVRDANMLRSQYADADTPTFVELVVFLPRQVLQGKTQPGVPSSGEAWHRYDEGEGRCRAVLSR